jgi:hypothetical protein
MHGDFVQTKSKGEELGASVSIENMGSQNNIFTDMSVKQLYWLGQISC